MQIIDGTLISNLNRVVESINAVNSTLIVCNHVPTAQMIFEEIVKKGVKDVVLLHSRFCRRDRDNIEKKIQKQLPKVLVATQVIEVSLDVDFEQAFSEPAPIDALIQRFGRKIEKAIDHQQMLLCSQNNSTNSQFIIEIQLSVPLLSFSGFQILYEKWT